MAIRGTVLHSNISFEDMLSEDTNPFDLINF